MASGQSPVFSVSDFLASVNQTLDFAYPTISIEGEIASFKVNQGKYVFFDLKDTGSTVGCFMTVWQLRVPVEDGMKVIIRATPKLTPWGKFSLTVQSIRPSGEGSLKKSFELLLQKLEKEGLFAEDRKRLLPRIPNRIGVISSTGAAGYHDFVTILNNRWGGLHVEVAHVQVQGEVAPDQMMRALKHFNTQEVPPEVIVIIRGGGSADDLSAFNDEQLVREIAASRVPTLVGVGHEVDVSLADMAADVRAATPSNAAQIIVPDRSEMIQVVMHARQRMIGYMEHAITTIEQGIVTKLEASVRIIDEKIDQYIVRTGSFRQLLDAYHPKNVLARGYAIVRGETIVGSMIEIEKRDIIIRAEVKHVSKT
ncbi:exodeoxyribonuclease VII large subunit [Microbacteriaceae bacterium]|nr:exodeoxyribonuclease VII large subunit [Candidatus Saccharibacteria bacterium]